MTPERWQQTRALFERVLGETPAARTRILEAECADDPSLMRDVEALLSAHEEATGFLGTAPRRFCPEPLIGRTAGQYQIHSTLGMGGMGIVYRAFDTRLDRYVALKVLPPESFSDEAREAFVREAKAASALNHPNIIAIYNTGNADDIHYIAMELVKGQTLAELIRGRALPVAEAVSYAIQLASALASAHSAGVVHRDIKPGNIMVIPPEGGAHTGLVKVLDFGLGTRGEIEDGPSSVRGTVSYMSPEQAEGRTVDERSDLFAFGCTFYEMLTGRRAFPGVSRAEVLGRIRDGVVPEMTSEIPPKCRALIRQCLQTDPNRRLQTARELLAALGSLEQDLGRQRFLRPALVIAATIILAGISWIWVRPGARAPKPERWVPLTSLPDSVGQPALSPDGHKVAFVRGPSSFAAAGQIYVKSLPDGEAIELTHDDTLKMSPVFSPDGSQIAYSTANRQNEWNTWVVPAAGGEPRLWRQNASGLVWFDKHITLYSEIKNRNVHMGIVARDEIRNAAHDVYLPADEAAMAHRSYPSPDGRWVLLVEMDAKAAWLPCRLAAMDGRSSGRPVGPPSAPCTFAAWSPDGKWMYVNSAAGGAFHIWRQRFPDGRPEQVTSGPTEEEGIAMASDGQSLITAVVLKQSTVWLHDSGEERQLVTEGYSFDPKFAAAGKMICYRVLKGTSAWTDPSELHVLDINSGRDEPLFPDLSLAGGSGLVYDVSPDGREVVTAAADHQGRRRLWLASIDRSEPPRQIPNAEGNQPLFERNGEILFHAADPPDVLFRVRRDGAGLQRVTEEPVLQRGAVSVDGRALAVRTLGPKGYFTEIYPLDGGRPFPIAPAGALDYFLRWSLDGSWIFLSIPSALFSERGRTYAVPLPHSKMLPDIPAEGFRSEAEIARLRGARRIDSFDIAPGPAPGIYAFARETLLRNLYRVPIP